MKSLNNLYRDHPLNAEAILARVRRNRRERTSRLTESDLAEDPKTEITDQNHVGGSRFVTGLADDAQVSAESMVLDLGSGLGGPARLLSWRYQCHVHGIDASKERCRDARKLTKLVGLQTRVTFACGDFLTLPVPDAKFDVIWGQGAWNHVKDKNRFLSRWMPALRIGGRIALEESIICHKSTKPREIQLLRKLSRTWRAYLVTRDEWFRVLRHNGCSITFSKDLSRKMWEDCGHMLSASAKIPDYPRSEREAFGYARELLEEGALGYVRIVAERA